MEKIVFREEFFNIKDTLCCGQVFRFKPYKKGYLIFSREKCAYAYNENGYGIVECENNDKNYFYNYFDLDRDYKQIYNSALNSDFEIIKTSARLGKGIRILNQDLTETTFSFIISQNNNIPKIKSTIEKLCCNLGGQKTITFENEVITYFAFPSVKKIAKTDIETLRTFSLGYRAEYIKKLAENILNGYSLEKLKELSTKELTSELLSLYGIGMKVANCVTLFGFHRQDSFPVDTWIEKVYKENFNGKLTNRNQITEYFLSLFGENAGYFQQYLFYFKRSLEK